MEIGGELAPNAVEEDRIVREIDRLENATEKLLDSNAQLEMALHASPVKSRTLNIFEESSESAST